MSEPGKLIIEYDAKPEERPDGIVTTKHVRLELDTPLSKSMKKRVAALMAGRKTHFNFTSGTITTTWNCCP